jgi:phage tail protein X
MITSDSRYINTILQTVEGPDGATRQEMRVPFPRTRVINYTNYRFIGDDRVDIVAHKFYGNGRLWWKIADANPQILDWLNVPPGTVVRVPSD